MMHPIPPCESRRTYGDAGFTLVELIVAATVLTILMTGVYVSFGNALRAWRVGEGSIGDDKNGPSAMKVLQDGRNAMSVMSRELNCILGGSQHLFQGKDDEIEFFTVAPPMDVDKGEGPRVLWVHYRFNRAGKSLVREEANVLKPLPLQNTETGEVDHARIKLGRKRKFELVVKGVSGLDFTYYWIPKPKDRKADEPPEWIDPIEMDEVREGWGLPQGVRATLTLKDSSNESGKTSLSLRIAFRGPTTPYNEDRIGKGDGKL